MKRRLRQKRLRAVERMVAESCRLCLWRPRGGSEDAAYQDIARGILEIQLMFLLREWAITGPGRLRPYRLKQVAITDVQESVAVLGVAGLVTWARSSGTGELTVEERFALRCPVPNPRRSVRSVRPVLILGDDGGQEPGRADAPGAA